MQMTSWWLVSDLSHSELCELTYILLTVTKFARQHDSADYQWFGDLLVAAIISKKNTLLTITNKIKINK